MKIFFITLLPALLLTNIVLAKPASEVTETNSFTGAILEMASQDSYPTIRTEPATPYTHESEKTNSLSRAVLAIQKVNVNLSINSASEVSYSRYSHESEKNNSLGRGALARK
ncbi:MAG: hypothetical protein COA83_11585 [Methylophaga sp.]|nr:MAG: hypothetical protein COA83_11585 [Methylophaga sp.]